MNTPRTLVNAAMHCASLCGLEIHFPRSVGNNLMPLAFVGVILFSIPVAAQIDNNGCVGANFGIDAGLYSGTIEYGDGSPATGTKDWFEGSNGYGIIDESQTAAFTSLLMAGGNPVYRARMNAGLHGIVDGQIMIDAMFGRDQFGGTGGIDITTYETSSKNGDNPAIWDIGQGNVQGKNDIIDVGGHMVRDGENLVTGTPSDLWFFGMMNRANPGGEAYFDFEFFVEDVRITPVAQSGDAGEGNFNSGGPQMGHTAFKFDQSTGEIKSVGDFIFNISFLNGGENAVVELRLWVHKNDYANITPANFSWGPSFDGPFNGSPFGYASIIPADEQACANVNRPGERPAAPPWGTLQGNTYQNDYIDYGLSEIGINMTAFGLDHASLQGTDPCDFPINTFLVKTRASASFSAALKDFAGPFEWTFPSNDAIIVGAPLVSCDNPIIQLAVSPARDDLEYTWYSSDGNIITDPNQQTVQVDQPGTYYLESTLPTTCPLPISYVVVGFDPDKPFFNEPTATTTVACNGNDGSIDLTASGATPPFTFAWYNASDPSTVISTDEDPTGLPPGDYYVEITDAIPCYTTSETFTVEPRTPTVISFVSSDVNCYGDSDGSIDATVTGQGPFTYSWSTGSSLEDINGLVAGDYTLTVTDADGCQEIAVATVTEPTEITTATATVDDTDPDPGVSNSSVDLTVLGGTPPYTYDWDYNGAEDPDTDPEDLTGVPAGDYTVTVTDANGCVTTTTTTVYEPEICDDGIDNDGDGVADCFDGDCGPPTPGIITPSTDPVCVGDVGITYTIASVVGVTGYDWTVPNGAVITAGQGTISITVTWVSSEGGQICVAALNTICTGPPSCIIVIPDDVPPLPGEITNGN